MIKITLPCDGEKAAKLKAGEKVYISGTLYTARDCAHKRLFAMLKNGEPLPIDLKEAVIYYAGPCPTPEGRASGSCGPTTANRVDVYTPALIENGLRFMVGKGGRSEEVIEAMKRNKCVYFAAIGGAGAFYGNAIKENTLVAFPDLLSEAVYRLKVDSFPAVVAIDSEGNSIF